MKRFLAFFLVVLMLMPTCFASFVATSDTFPEAGTCYVEIETEVISTGGGPRGGRKATKEQIEAAVKSPKTVITEAQREAAKQELGLSNSTRATWTYLQGYVVYSQSTSYNCGPAAVQAALRYINGYAPAQSSVASGCSTTTAGTYVSNMVTYINGQQSRRVYEAEYYYQFTGDFNTDLYDGVVVRKAPAIVGLYFNMDQGWAYNSGLHFMSVYGAMSDKSRFALADPWVGYAGLTNIGWSYAKSAQEISSAYDSDLGLLH